MASAGAVALFTWLAVDSWVNARRKEREAFYRSETIRRIADSAGGPDGVIRFIREEERISTLKTRERLKLAGLISAGGGIGFGFFAVMIQLTHPAWSITLVPVSLALIPALVGIAMLTYVYVLAQKQ
jgi:hypothetical protein